MLWVMIGTLAAIWAVLTVPFALFVLWRRRRARRRVLAGLHPRTGAPL